MLKHLFFIFPICVFATAVFAASKLNPLSPGDLSALGSGASCWLESKKSNQYFYDDMAHGLVKLNKKVIKLDRKAGDWDSGFFLCGKTYEYISADKQTHAFIKMKKGKGEICVGSLRVTGTGRTSKISALKSNCGE